MTLPDDFRPSQETIEHHNRVLTSAEYQKLLEVSAALRTVLSYYICDMYDVETGMGMRAVGFGCEAADVFDALVVSAGNRPWVWTGERGPVVVVE